MRIEVTRCDGCGADIPAGARRFMLKAVVTRLNGKPPEASPQAVRELADVCGEECLHTALKQMVMEVEGDAR